MKEIYGYQHENKRIEGVIDCETESQFNISLGRKWDAIEVSETGKETPEFHPWFKKVKAEDCKRNLLKPIQLPVLEIHQCDIPTTTMNHITVC